MAIRIGSNISSLQAQRRLSDTSSALSKTYERLSSGQRINQASDDAAGLAISETLCTKARVYGQGVRNINDSISMTAVAEQALGTLKDITIRQQELAQQAANGVYSGTQREALNKECEQLTNEYNRVILSTAFNGRSLFGTTWESIATQAGFGSDGSISFKIGDELAAKITPGSYFTVNDNTGLKCLYFKVDGQGSAPDVPGAASMQAVNLYTSATAQTTDFSFVDVPQDGKYIWLNVPGRSYYVWFDSGGAVDPEGGDTGIRIDTNGKTKEEVMDAVAIALQDTNEFSVSALNSGTLQVANKATGQVDYCTGSDDGLIVASTVQYGHDQITTPAQVAQAVRGLLGLGSTSLDGKGSLTITLSTTGNSHDAQDVNSNTWVSILQQGSGTETYSMGSVPYDITYADLNNDGNMDMVTANYWSNNVGVRLGYGDGTFGSCANYAGLGNARRITTADVNGDGYRDLMLGDSGVSVFINRGNGTFNARASYTMDSYPKDVAAADINGDNLADMICTNGSGILVRLNSGNGNFGNITSFYGAGTSPVRFKMGDLNGDGRPDLVATESGILSIWENGGDGTFGSPNLYVTGAGANASQPALGDFNGDGKLDIATGDDTDGTISIRLNNGDGTFGSRSTFASGMPSLMDLEAADLNGDGRADLVSVSFNQAKVMVYTNTGSGFAATAYADTANEEQTIGLADLNSDGKLDIGYTFYSVPQNGVRIRLNNSNGTFTDPRGNRAEIIQLSFGDARGRVQVNQVDLTSRSAALTALTTLSGRLDRITAELGVIGAGQSRLESAAKTLAASAENFKAAGSRIIDADIAYEAAALTRLQISQQAAASVLAQANQQPALAVRLLQ